MPTSKILTPEQVKQLKDEANANSSFTLLRHACTRCGHVWVARVIIPKKCPKCQNKYWNKARKYVTKAVREARREEEALGIKNTFDSIKKQNEKPN